MRNYLIDFASAIAALDRLIDNCHAAGRQEEMKQLKSIRLRIKDKIAAFQSQRSLLAG